MFEVGRVCVKIAGRDAGKQCVVIEVLENNFVMVDGQARRRKANVNHLMPLEKTLKVKKGASHEEVAKAFESLGVEVRTTKPKKPAPRPCKVRKAKPKADKPAKKEAKPAPKKEAKPVKKEAPKAEAKPAQ
jgi:large subunit ribosomal protein L14e